MIEKIVAIFMWLILLMCFISLFGLVLFGMLSMWKAVISFFV